MLYQSYIPTRLEGLAHVIWEQRSTQPMRWQILPSGYVELIFNLGPKMANVQGKRVGNTINPTEHFCFLSGLHTKPLYLGFPEFHVMGVQMNPAAIKAFFGIPCLELKDWYLEGDLLLEELGEMEDRLRAPTPFLTKARWLEHYLCEKLDETSELYTVLKINTVVDKLSSLAMAGESFRLEDLMGYSRTHTHRLFTEWFGQSATNHLKLRQFVQAIRRIHASDERLTDIAFQEGFYDQPHFVRAFRQFAGMTPGQYRRQKSDLIGQLPA